MLLSKNKNNRTHLDKCRHISTSACACWTRLNCLSKTQTIGYWKGGKSKGGRGLAVVSSGLQEEEEKGKRLTMEAQWLIVCVNLEALHRISTSRSITCSRHFVLLRIRCFGTNIFATWKEKIREVWIVWYEFLDSQIYQRKVYKKGKILIMCNKKNEIRKNLRLVYIFFSTRCLQMQPTMFNLLQNIL